MARWCRVFFGFVLAVVIARGSITVSWNTHPSPQPGAAVQGTHVFVRLHDGSTHRYVTTPAEARLLQSLIGTVIRFRVP